MWQQTEQLNYTFKFHKLSILLAFYIVLLCLTVCFANNFISIQGLTLPGGILVFPITFIICDVVSEVYGYSIAKAFIWIGIIAELIFSSLSLFIIQSPHPEFFQHAEAYNTVFKPTMRYVLSGMAGFLFGEFLNIYVLAKWKIKVKGRYFPFRSVCTTAIGQGFLSIIVDSLAFYGKVTNQQLLTMMLTGWAIKMIYSLCFVMPAWALVHHLKKRENIDVYDTKTNFNPFRF